VHFVAFLITSVFLVISTKKSSWKHCFPFFKILVKKIVQLLEKKYATKSCVCRKLAVYLCCGMFSCALVRHKGSSMILLGLLCCEQWEPCLLCLILLLIFYLLPSMQSVCSGYIPTKPAIPFRHPGRHQADCPDSTPAEGKENPR